MEDYGWEERRGEEDFRAFPQFQICYYTTGHIQMIFICPSHTEGACLLTRVVYGVQTPSTSCVSLYLRKGKGKAVDLYSA